MKLNALLMSREPHSMRVLAAAMDELQIEHEACASTAEALELLAQRYYSGLVADFDIDMATQLVRLARMAPAQRRPVVFGVIGTLTNISTAFQAGSNFIFYKPLAFSQVLRTMRGGRVFMRPDRRRSSRHQLETLVYLRFGDLCAIPAIVTNVSERGLAVQAGEPLPAGRVPLHFILPGTEYLIEGDGEVIWADEDGRAGILFNQLAGRSVQELRTWLVTHAHKKGSERVIVESPQRQASRSSGAGSRQRQ
ncbi:MAG TPA: PilZ domain-containing protein [Terriglobales bacterium]|nr:PilZ domain-containing protein [Terriglobales bacterium]